MKATLAELCKPLRDKLSKKGEVAAQAKAARIYQEEAMKDLRDIDFAKVMIEKGDK